MMPKMHPSQYCTVGDVRVYRWFFQEKYGNKHLCECGEASFYSISYNGDQFTKLFLCEKCCEDRWEMWELGALVTT